MITMAGPLLQAFQEARSSHTALCRLLPCSSWHNRQARWQTAKWVLVHAAPQLVHKVNSSVRSGGTLSRYTSLLDMLRQVSEDTRC